VYGLILGIGNVTTTLKAFTKFSTLVKMDDTDS